LDSDFRVQTDPKLQLIEGKK